MHQDRGGGAPDFLGGVGPDPVVSGAGLSLLGGLGVEEGCQGEFEEGGDFVERELGGVGLDQADDRGDAEAGAGGVGGEAADQGDFFG